MSVSKLGGDAAAGYTRLSASGREWAERTAACNSATPISAILAEKCWELRDCMPNPA